MIKCDQCGKKKFTKDFIEAIKEEVLQKNLGSFVIDW
jgi:hypothetical protein